MPQAAFVAGRVRPVPRFKERQGKPYALCFHPHCDRLDSSHRRFLDSSQKGIFKKIWAILAVFLLVLIVEISLLAVPVENLVYTFPSPEAAIAYQSGHDVIDTVSAENSTLVLLEDGSRINFSVLKRTEKGWKLSSLVANPKFIQSNGAQNPIDEKIVWRYHCAGESYVIVYTAQSQPVNVSDSIGSVFQKITASHYGDVYVASVKDMDSSYCLTVDEQLFYPFT